jgi:hypothetical protein
MIDVNAINSGIEVYNELLKLKGEREDIESVIELLSTLEANDIFSAHFISEHNVDAVNLFENSVVFPIQGTRAYSSFSPELEKFFLFDLKENDKQIITKAKKDFQDFKESLEKHRVDVIYDIMKFIELGRMIDSFYLSDIVVDIVNTFSRKHVVNFFTNYHKIGVIKSSFEEERPILLFVDYKNVENGYKLTVNVSTESLIKNKVDINQFLDILSSGCSGAVKSDRMSVSTSFFDNLSVFYKGYYIDKITKKGDYELLSNKKKKKITKLFYQR